MDIMAQRNFTEGILTIDTGVYEVFLLSVSIECFCSIFLLITM